MLSDYFEIVNCEEMDGRLDFWMDERELMEREDYKKGTVHFWGFTEEKKITETMRDDGRVLLVLTHLNLLLVKVDVETSVSLLKPDNVKVVYQYIWEYLPKKLSMIHAAKVQLYS